MELHEKRAKLVAEGQELVQKLSTLAKSDPARPAVVGRKMTVDQELKAVNKALRAANREAAGGADVTSVVARAAEAIEPIHLYAAVAMAALINQYPERAPDTVAEDAWKYAEALDDAG